MLRRLAIYVVVAVFAFAIGIYAAFQLSPWPSVILIRQSFADGGKQASDAVAPLVPAGIRAQTGLSYAREDKDAAFDLFRPAEAKGPLPTVVWVHGGGFVAGSRADLSNYLKVLASRGFATVAIDYSRAPGARFPTPVRQTNAALAYLRSHAAQLGIDPNRIFLAGDSAGAQIASQTALVISDPTYARRIGIQPGMPRGALRGLVLYCGPHAPTMLKLEGPFGSFMRTVIWSYMGTRDPKDPRIGEMSVVPHVTYAYPPSFISVGNADGLAPQSVALAQALQVKGVEADTLFFPADHQPPLGHEYQMNLPTEAGRLAFDRSVAFLTAHAR